MSTDRRARTLSSSIGLINRQSSRRRLGKGIVAIAVAAAAGSLFAGSAQATSQTWTGAALNGLWSDINNWNGAIPGATTGTTNGDTATFNITGSGVTIDAGRNIKSILFDTGAGAFTFSGSPLAVTNAGAITINPGVTSSEEFDNAFLGSPNATATTYGFLNNSTTVGANLIITGAFTGQMTATQETITLGGSNNGTYSGVISDGVGGGKVAVTKSGIGSWSLTNANTYTGTTSVANGSLNLDFTAGGAPASNILSPSSTLQMAGGTLNIVGGSNSQTVTNLSLGAGSGKVNVPAGSSLTFTNTTSGSTAATTPGIQAHGTVQFSTTGTITFPAATSAAILFDSSNIAYATYGTDDWAATNVSGNVIAATYTNVADGKLVNGVNNTITASNAAATTNGAQTPLSIRFADPTGRTLTLGTGVITTGGILVASTAGASFLNGGSIRGSRISASSNYDFNVIQNSPNDFTIGTSIGNASSATNCLIKSGSGRLILTNTANGYSGAQGTFINDGILSVANNGSLGAAGIPVTFNGGSLEATASFALDASGGTGTTPRNLVMNRDGTIAVTGSNTLIASGVVSGVGGLIKTGTGTLSLTGTNTYSGNTQINAGTIKAANATSSLGSAVGTTSVNNNGTLTGAGTILGAVIGNSGGHIAPGDAGIGTLGVGGLTLNSGSVLDFELSSPASHDQINISGGGTLAVTNGDVINLYQPGTTNPFVTSGTYDLVQLGGGGIAGNPMTSFTVGNPVGGVSYGFAVSGSTLQLTIGSSAIVSSWASDVNGNWGDNSKWTAGIPTATLDTANFPTNLGPGGTDPLVTLDSDRTISTINFGTVGTSSPYAYTIGVGGGTLHLNGGAGSAIVNNVGGNHVIATPVSLDTNTTFNVNNDTGVGVNSTTTITGVIGGSSGLTAAGTGKLILTAANNYAGNTTINAGGTLQLGNGGATGSVTSTNIFDNGSLVFNINGSPSVGNAITGTGSVTFGNTGTTTLTAANGWSGATNINTGTVLLSGGTLGTGALTMAGGTLLNINGTATSVGTLSGSGTIDNGSASAVTLSVNNTATSSFSGVISNTGGGALSLTKTGAGVLTLSGVNTYTGATTVTGGLTIDSTGVINGSTLNNNNGGGPGITVNGGSMTFSGLATFTNGGFGLTVNSGSATFNGGVNFATDNANNGNAIFVNGGNFSASSMTMGRTSLSILTEPATGSATLGLYVNGGSASITGALNMGTASASNSSVSTRIDSGSLTVGGPITIGLNNGGRWSVLDVGGGTFGSTDAASGVILGGPQAGNAAFLVRGGTATVEKVTFGQGAIADTAVLALSGGSLYVGSGGMVLGTSNVGEVTTTRLGTATLGAKADWTSAATLPISLVGDTTTGTTIQAADAVAAPHNITLNGVISGTGAISKTGGGTLLLTGLNTYTGDTVVSAGTLTLDAAGAIASSNINVTAPGIANINGGVPTTVTVNANGATNFGGNSGIVTTTRQIGTLNVGASTTASVRHSAFPFTPAILNPAAVTFVDGTSHLDLTNNQLLTPGDAPTAEALIVAGKLVSSEADSSHALGYITSGANMEVRFTLKGDTNLDGSVDVGDLGALATSYGLTGGQSWANGDFNRDDNVDVGDLGALATNYGTQLAAGPSFDGGLAASPQAVVAGGASAAVPEPTSIGLIGVGAIGLLTRRRRASR